MCDKVCCMSDEEVELVSSDVSQTYTIEGSRYSFWNDF
jgi:hypothetical protein